MRLRKFLIKLTLAAVGACFITLSVWMGQRIRREEPAQVLVIPYLIPIDLHDYSSWAKFIQLALDRTEYLHTVMETMCKPDGYGVRVHLPDPPPGWQKTKNTKDLSGAWSLGK